MTHAHKVEALRRQGVEVHAPETLEIGDEVALENIRGPGTVLHAGTRLRGAELMIMAGARLGAEAPVTVESCAVGRRVKLAGGYHAGAVYLDDAVVGSGAQIRGGTLFEEQANAAHTVGTKMTVLLPFVTLGSLINFCDVLMAGGTSRRDHSEVGSSFIHFNFTPFGKSGDKATPSLIGDVPRGVMLRSPRIFLGGQAGIVGPLEIGFGSVLAAGFVYRRDHGDHELVVGEALTPQTRPASAATYRRIRAKVEKNLRYIGNLAALWQWYEQVRAPLARADAELVALYGRAQQVLDDNIAERIKRLEQLAGYMDASIAQLETRGDSARDEIADQRAFADHWPRSAEWLGAHRDRSLAEAPELATLRAALDEPSSAGGYVAAIQQGLDDRAVAAGSAWLERLVEQTVAGCGAFGT